MEKSRLGESRTTGVGRRLRRAIVLAAALLLLPNVAQGAFRGSASAPLTVGTAALATPADMSFSTTCPVGQTSGTVRIKSFSEVPHASGYVIQVSQAGQVVASQSVTGSQAVNLTFTRRGTFELSVMPTLKSWTGVPLTRSFTC